MRGGIDGFVCAHVLGHLDRSRRRALFQGLDARLAQGGVGLVTTQQAPDAIEGAPLDGDGPEPTETRRLGRYDYRVSYLPSDGNEHFRSRYEVWEGNERLRQTIFEGDRQTVTVQDLAADLKGLNLTIAEAHDGVAGIRRP